jgi:uncharacterized repeat protein (TIGR03803 family)
MWRNHRGFRTGLMLLAVAFFPFGKQAQAQTVSVLYSFTNAPGDGAYPEAGLIKDASGNLYGTTAVGGNFSNGTVFELVNSSGTYSEQVLFSFTGGIEGIGASPEAGLIMDASGNLYGTTEAGGSSGCSENTGCGTVFELLNSSGTYNLKVLHDFTSTGGDGASPFAGLIMDASGNLYGTTFGGGPLGPFGNGTVFELVNSSGTYSEKVLYSFTGTGGDGVGPSGVLIMDASGNLYGTTRFGGTSGNGTVFELVNSSGTYSEQVLYSFTGTGGDGASPFAGLIMDASGNLYGTTASGGTPVPAGGSGCIFGCGTVFELVNSSGTYSEKVLYSFPSTGVDGELPSAGLIMDASGNLYGTTIGGGTDGLGTVFELVNSSGTYSEKLLYSFTGTGGDGAGPSGVLIIDASGDLYGTTVGGGTSSFGTVFRLTPAALPAPPSGSACNGTYNGTFNGTVTLSSGQVCNFVSGGDITGNVIVNGGNLMLNGATVGGNIQNTGATGGNVTLTNATVNGGLQLASGNLTLTNSTVDGNLQISGTATYSVDLSRIRGNLQVTNVQAGPAQNQVCGATISGNLQLVDNGTAVEIGSTSASCPGNNVGGSLQVTNNYAPVQIFDNVIKGSLQCVGNVSIMGAGNSAAHKQQQCATF